MEISENKTHPWQHPLYKLLRGMYHPFLFHNHLYFEMNDRKLQKLLMERDSFIRAIECKLVYFELTEKERDWLFYLRDCCLFEVHRRKFKSVLADILKLTCKNDSPTIHELFKITQTSSHRKVWSWLISIDNLFDAGDYQRNIDEYLERLQGDNNGPELSHDELEHPQESKNNLQYPESNIEDLEQILPNVQYLQLSDNESDHPADQAECSQQHTEQPNSEYVLWPEYPRLSQQNSPLFEPETVANPESLECQLSRRYEFQLIAEPRVYKQEKRKVEEPESQQDQYVLKPHFVKNAIQSALDYKGSSQFLFQSFAESQHNRLIITWDELTESIKKINLDYEKNMRMSRKAPDSFRFDTPPTASNTFSSSDENFAFDQIPTTVSNTWFTQSDSKYITPGTYLVPKASLNAHIKVGPITLKPVPEEEGSEEQYPHNVAIPQSNQEGASLITPPTLPTYIETDEKIRSLASQPPLIPSRKRSASSMDDNFNSITSGDLQSDYYHKFDMDSIVSNKSNEFRVQSTPPISHNTLEDASEDLQSEFNPEFNDFDYNQFNQFFFPSVPPNFHNTPHGESTISESEIESQSDIIDGTIPEAEPDFTNLPLPETPDDKENT